MNLDFRCRLGILSIGDLFTSHFSVPTETDTTAPPQFPLPEVAPPEPVRSPPSLGLRSNPATHRETSRQDPEAEALAALEVGIAQEQEWQPLAEKVRETCESVKSFLPLERDVRRGTQMDLERIIANGLANITEGPSLKARLLKTWMSLSPPIGIL
jgi:hypothetical protein